MKSITFLENVKWTINSDVAAISDKLKDGLINTIIELHDFENNKILFDSIDIRRDNINKNYKGIDLYRNGDIFEPHLGNSSAVPIIEKALEQQTKRLNRLKNEENIEKTKKILHKLHILYNIENRRWTDKQFCLRTQSQAMRNKAILETISGDQENPGWLGYNFLQSMYLDYRGRIYNRDPYFSYQSNDLVRGHFLFADKKEVTQEGAEYTFIHIACSYNQTYTIKEIKKASWLELDYVTELEADGLTDISVDKMGINDKHNWTIEHIEMLLDIAEDPIKHINICSRIF